MKYAVVRIKGKQYKVEEGGELLVALHGSKEKVDAKVLLYVNGKSTKVGTPVLEGVKIKLKNLGNVKGKKLHVYKFKAKSRYRRKIGFRPQYTKVLIEKIG